MRASPRTDKNHATDKQRRLGLVVGVPVDVVSRKRADRLSGSVRECLSLFGAGEIAGQD